ncbi:aspartate aminotransferase family protein [Candidatus Kaiserbacteria bacterium]|nr:aspartate aminotransferase family protein [Candidatus Kaiserbacteria bacterium]
MDDPTVMELISKYSARNYHRLPFVADHAEGPFLYNQAGERAIDMLASYSTILVAHGWDVPINALNEVAAGKQRLDLVPNLVPNRYYARFCETVCTYTGYDRVLVKNGGTEATASALHALKLHAQRRRNIKKPEVIVIQYGFHGRVNHFQSMYASEETAYPKLVTVAHSAEAVEAAINENTVGILMEIHRGEGGPLFDKTGEYRNIYTVARRHGLLIVVDEIQTGLDRCGYRMAWQKFGPQYRPDAVTLGKVLGGGLIPISALVGTEDFMSIFEPGDDGSTYGGNAGACAVATAILEYLTAHPLDKRAWEVGTRFSENLRDIPHVSVEYEGALIAVKITGLASGEPIARMLLSGRFGPRVFSKEGRVHGNIAYVRVSPVIGTSTNETIDEASDAFRHVLRIVSERITHAHSKQPIDISF